VNSPILLVVVEIYLLVELHRTTIEVGEKIGLIVVSLFDAGQSFNYGLWMNHLSCM
jgi:hypothetical protein